MPRKIIFDTLFPVEPPKKAKRPAQAALVTSGVPPCVVCNGRASMGLRRPGWQYIRDPIRIWVCRDHEDLGQRKLIEELPGPTLPLPAQDDGGTRERREKALDAVGSGSGGSHSDKSSEVVACAAVGEGGCEPPHDPTADTDYDL